ncbi:MAG TPA: pullulanase-type alpha-1,6-glucosidase [Anaerolineae bacterium]|nr:pullulanase-type alpha-1,6-glucosidase [Anaerolineae bacterium]
MIRTRLTTLFAIVATFILLVVSSTNTHAHSTQDHTPPPTSVTLAGTMQTLLGCDDDWRPDCAATQLQFDDTHQLWLATFEIPAGDYEYKVALNNTWDENYGANAAAGGDNLALSLDGPTLVTFIYDHKTHWTADNYNNILANVAGSFQGELGCEGTSLATPEGDWAPDCLRTLLQDPDGDGTYEFLATTLPAGDYEAKVAVNQGWGENYGEEGAPGGANIGFNVPKNNAPVLFTWDSDTKIMTISAEGAAKGSLSNASAYWVNANTILTPLPATPGTTFTFYYDLQASLELTNTGVIGGQAIPLSVVGSGPNQTITDQFPHLANLTTLYLETQTPIADILRGQFALETKDADGNIIDITALQIPGVLDDLYTYDGALGPIYNDDTPTLHLWAPTARNVTLHLFADANPATTSTTYPMTRDNNTGVWSITGQPDWTNQYYLYEVDVYIPSLGEFRQNLVTDPYSLSLSANSQRTQLIDPAADNWQPTNWNNYTKPPLNSPLDSVIYELHIRDFSIFDESVPADHRGTFMAFTHRNSNGMTHLRNLAQAGLTHIHLLPVFDIATINEIESERVEPSLEFLSRGEPNSPMQQGGINALRDSDGFNWGYDPFHYTAPEGSYATDPNGAIRVLEFRNMVQALNQNGLRVVMDVVYNHTNSSGQSEYSVLDRIVPGYYHRLSKNGKVETSTCCQNTATEHNMMRKLMVDSVVTWATTYKVDGFRFDLMGHHMVEDMQAVRDALDALTLEKDGVDGQSIYVYGEGWNFGEVANNARGLNATQLNIGGMGIGSFNDRLRDAARGGNPFGGEQEQGFINGLYTDPNETDQGTSEEQLTDLLLSSDQIRLGLAGNLANYSFVTADGNVTAGRDIDYNGSPAGYTQQPDEHIVYVSAHDNETLFDAIQFKAPLDTSPEQRVRMQNLGLDLVMFSQGIPFFHAGSDMLRSKSMDRNSYNSGDWFNRLDFTYQTNNWAVGLPPAADNESKWPLIDPLLANPDLAVNSQHIMANVNHFQEILAIRQSTPLFRLPTATHINNQLQFHNTGPDQIPGLIAMSISDDPNTPLDPNYSHLVVIFNGRNDEQTISIPDFATTEFKLHPIQKDSADITVRLSRTDEGTFTVPARTTAIFVADAPPPPPSPAPSWPAYLAAILAIGLIIWAIAISGVPATEPEES